MQHGSGRGNRGGGSQLQIDEAERLRLLGIFRNPTMRNKAADAVNNLGPSNRGRVDNPYQNPMNPFIAEPHGCDRVEYHEGLCSPRGRPSLLQQVHMANGRDPFNPHMGLYSDNEDDDSDGPFGPPHGHQGPRGGLHGMHPSFGRRRGHGGHPGCIGPLGPGGSRGGHGGFGVELYPPDVPYSPWNRPHRMDPDAYEQCVDYMLGSDTESEDDFGSDSDMGHMGPMGGMGRFGGVAGQARGYGCGRGGSRFH